MKTWLFMIGMPVLQIWLGTGVLGLLYGGQSRKLYMADRLLVGFMAEIGLAELSHLAGAVLGRSFADVCRLFGMGVVVLSILSMGVWLWTRRNERAGGGNWRRKHVGRSDDVTPFVAGLFLVFCLMVIYQIMVIVDGDFLYRTGDMTVETVESFLEEDGVYRINPLTGNAYTGGVPLRIRILCLPTLYGILCRLFQMSATELVWKLIPLHVLLMSYLAYVVITRTLFARKKDGTDRLLFMTLIAAVFCVGNYLYGMDGFNLLYCGFRGVAIRNAVLLPYVFGLALRRKWRLAVFCILAELCIVWTLYGMGACLAVTLGMAAVRLWQKRRSHAIEEAGEEA